MVECNFTEISPAESIDTSNLNNQQFRRNKISEIEDYYATEIKERELMHKNLVNIFLFLIILISL